MKAENANMFRLSTKCALQLALAAGLIVPAPFVQARAQRHEHSSAPVSPRLVQVVRDSTKQYQDVNAATGAGYQQFLGCVSGPDHGAMGIHYVNFPLVADGLIDAQHPEALIYEPSNGQLKLVGVEYIVDAETWLKNNKGMAPVLEGQSFQFVDTPNRYGIGSIFELHVWAWRDNPNGAFVDWNDEVSCGGQ
ncbi:MAG TPA: hypothetical protein VKD70_18045 [Candidatus Acidoferrum sp.]|nr:hypothetical protein [Candidatus Acidoferrum sp.]